MKTGAIIQASTSSVRLPKKVLYPLQEYPVLSFIVDTLSQITPPLPIVVATSNEDWDDVITTYCRKTGYNWYRGPFKNVALRILETADANGFDTIVRINGDSPLIDYRIVEQALSLFQKGDFDLVTNTHPRTFPVGQSVEVMKKEALRSVVTSLKETQDKEHVTRYFYKNEAEYKIHNFPNKLNMSHIRLALDTMENRTIIERIVSKMSKPHWQYRMDDIIEIYSQVS